VYIGNVNLCKIGTKEEEGEDGNLERKGRVGVKE